MLNKLIKKMTKKRNKKSNNNSNKKRSTLGKKYNHIKKIKK